MPERVPSHRQPRPMKQHRPRSKSSKGGYDWDWAKFRQWFINRHPCCDICGRPTEEVHHIKRLQDYPELRLVEENCQPLCKKHHKEMTQRQRGLGRGTVVLICGPPGAGKTSHARQHMKPGDLLLDWDLLMQALSAEEIYHRHPVLVRFVEAAYQGVIDLLRKQGMQGGTAWIIRSLPDVHKQQELAKELNAKLELLVPTMNECVERTAEDPHRRGQAAMWKDRIAQWFSIYNRSREQ